ncbi:MAG TPA: hypothetical protein VF496_10695, partial [Candidatus Deferrimicrobium sp.]
MTALPGLFPCTGVGSLPHLDARTAVFEVLSRFREIPYWPQLPRRTPLEHMYPQFAAALPGASDLGERLTMKSGETLLPAAEAFYAAFLSGDLSPFAIPAERAAGLHALLAAGVGPFPAVKGQVTGPVSFGLMVCDREKKPVFYDPVGRDVLVKYLLRVAQWQVSMLRRLSDTVILTLDELRGQVPQGRNRFDAAPGRIAHKDEVIDPPHGPAGEVFHPRLAGLSGDAALARPVLCPRG